MELFTISFQTITFKELKIQIDECHCKHNGDCILNMTNWLPKLIPEFSNWISNQSGTICRGDQTCDICADLTDAVLQKIEQKNFRLHQTYFLIDILCEEGDVFSTCQSFLSSDWQELEPCLTGDDGILSNLSCIYYGNCLGSNHNWICTEV